MELIFRTEQKAFLFWSRIVVIDETDCWEWRGTVNASQYGVFGNRSTHSIGYMVRYGAVPDGLHLDHLCVNPRCVNPAHLEAVTPSENSSRTARFGMSVNHRQVRRYVARARWVREGLVPPDYPLISHPRAPARAWVIMVTVPSPERRARNFPHMRYVPQVCLAWRLKQWIAREGDEAVARACGVTTARLRFYVTLKPRSIPESVIQALGYHQPDYSHEAQQRAIAGLRTTRRLTPWGQSGDAPGVASA